MKIRLQGLKSGEDHERLGKVDFEDKEQFEDLLPWSYPSVIKHALIQIGWVSDSV